MAVKTPVGTDLHRFLVAHATEVLVAASATGVIELCSPSSFAVFGIDAEQLPGSTVAELVDDADRERMRACLISLSEPGTDAEIDAAVVHRLTGELRHMQVLLRCVAEEARTLLHITFLDRTAQRLSEVARRAVERRFVGLTSQTSELVVDVDLTGTITYVSPSSIHVLGHSHEEATGRAITDFIHPDDFPDLLRQFLGQESAEPTRHRAVHADGSYRWLETLARIMTDDAGERTSVLLSSRDITDQLALERNLDRERRLLTAILDNVHAGVIAVDVDRRVLCANAAFCHLFGTEFVIGTSLLDYQSTHQLMDGDDRPIPVAERPIERVLHGGDVVDQLFHVVSADGSRFEVSANAAPIVGRDGAVTAAVLTYEDVTALRSAQDELRRLATVDTLTDLPNRRHVVTHLEEAMRRNARTPHRLAVLFADLDGFKAVNDDLGHEAGDELLRASGRRLRQYVRVGDVLARYGGDEFVVVIEDDDARSEAARIARRLEHEMSRPFALSTGQVKIGSSVGLAVVEATDTIALVLAKADAAMYQRKTERRASRTAVSEWRPVSQLG